MTRKQEVALLCPGLLSLTCHLRQAHACGVSPGFWVAIGSQGYAGQLLRIIEMTVLLRSV